MKCSCGNCVPVVINESMSFVGQEELLQALIDEKHAKDEPDEVT